MRVSDMKKLAAPFLLALALAAPLSANSTLRVDFRQLSHMAERVVAGRITNITASQDPDSGYIYSTVTVSVSQAVPAQLAGRDYSFRMLGGELNGRIQYIADYPKLRTGSEVVLFLNSDTASVFGPTIGLGQGVFFLGSSPSDSAKRVMDRFGRPVLGIREARLIRGMPRMDDPAAAALGASKSSPGLSVGEFFEQIRQQRALSPLQTPLGR
jgi:hypothetical protein